MKELNIKEFKEPILSSIYNIIGALVVILGVLVAIFTLIGSGFFGSAVSGVGGCGVVVVITALIALPLFGIAQVITYFGRTAFHAQSIDESLATTLYQMQKTVTSISEQMKTSSNPPTPPAPPRPAERMLNCPHCNAEIPVRTVSRGVNTCPDCRKPFEAE